MSGELNCYELSQSTGLVSWVTPPAPSPCVISVIEEQARMELPWLLEQTSSSHEPVQITGKRAAAVLVSEEA